MISRRDVLPTAAAGVAMSATAAAAASFGNPDEPPQGAVNATNPASVTDPGPHSPAIADQFPAASSPLATDVGDMPQFWASFNNAPKRIQNGGWGRPAAQDDFQISETIAGVNMRLTAGGVRELHWHVFSEWAFMTYGSCRITVLDPAGHAYVADVNQGDIWFFPAGFPHSLQGLGPDGAEFILAFDDGHASEFNTLLVTDFVAHTPPDILAQNFSVPPEAFSKRSLHDLYIFQGNLPGLLPRFRAAVWSAQGPPKNPFTF